MKGTAAKIAPPKIPTVNDEKNWSFVGFRIKFITDIAATANHVYLAYLIALESLPFFIQSPLIYFN